MEQIIVGFSNTKHKYLIGSDIIKKIERTNFSHTYIKFYSEKYQRNLICQATLSMVHIISEDKFLQDNNVIYQYKIQVSEQEKNKIIQHILDIIGSPYGKIQIIGMLISRLLYLWFGLKIKNPFRDGEKSQVCSDLVYYLLKDKIQDFEPEWDGPKQIHKQIQKIGILIKE